MWHSVHTAAHVDSSGSTCNEPLKNPRCFVVASRLQFPTCETLYMRGMFSSHLVKMQGSFCKRTFAAYNLYEREFELSEVPTEEMEVG